MYSYKLQKQDNFKKLICLYRPRSVSLLCNRIQNSQIIKQFYLIFIYNNDYKKNINIILNAKEIMITFDQH